MSPSSSEIQKQPPNSWRGGLALPGPLAVPRAAEKASSHLHAEFHCARLGSTVSYLDTSTPSENIRFSKTEKILKLERNGKQHEPTSSMSRATPLLPAAHISKEPPGREGTGKWQPGCEIPVQIRSKRSRGTTQDQCYIQSESKQIISPNFIPI